MVTEVKQSKYTTESSILRRLCTRARTLVLLQRTDIFMDPLVNLFHQNYLLKPFIKFTIFQSLIDCDQQNSSPISFFMIIYDHVNILTFFHNMLKNRLWQANMAWNFINNKSPQ